MNVRRPVLTLLASGVLALVAVALAAQWVGERGQMATDTVVVAVRELPSGTRLAPQMLRTIDWPAGHRPERSFAEPQALVGRVLVSALNKDEPVLEGRLADRLHISESTLRNHLTSIYDKLGVANKSALLMHAVKNGFTRHLGIDLPNGAESPKS